MTSLYHAYSLYNLCSPATDQELPRGTLGQSRVQAVLPLVALSVFWQSVRCPSESKSPLSSLRLVEASSRQRARSGVRYQETVYFQDVKMHLIVWQGSRRQHTLKNDGASTDPWEKPSFKIRFRLTRLPRNTEKFRWLVRLATSLIVVRHLVAFDNFIMSPT